MMMETDNMLTEYVLIRQGHCLDNSILRLYQNNLLGRDITATVPVISLYVSRKHCFLRQGADDQWYISDCGTLNGTYINDMRLCPNNDYILRVGDRIGLGVSMNFLNHREYSEDSNYHVYQLVNSNNPPNHLGCDINNLCRAFSNIM